MRRQMNPNSERMVEAPLSTIEVVESETVEYSDEELAFLRAIDRYKRVRDRRFLAWHEVLAVVKSLGYRKG